ncbi:hypothetical protein [Brucella sp. IR073]|uniref:hypothetical protein n=1 Tax=unclassified Brucella TaxID=2632610 RepID=UPI003B97D579
MQVNDKAVEAAARDLAEYDGQDPDELAPLSVMCTADNKQVPWWVVFEEQARIALEAAQPALAHDEPVAVDGVGYAMVQVNTPPDVNGWCLCTPFNHPEDVAKGHVEGELAVGSQFFGQVFAAPQPSGPVQVEPLKWHRRKGRGEWYADTPVGRYEVGVIGAFWVATLRSIKDGQWEDDVVARKLSPMAAKAAVQADYERRILAAIAQAPAPVVADAPGAVEAFNALDLADRLIERGYGTDTPKEWHDAYKAVARARRAKRPHPASKADELAAARTEIERYQGALEAISSRSAHQSDPQLHNENRWDGDMSEAFFDGEAQANYECAVIARAALNTNAKGGER